MTNDRLDQIRRYHSQVRPNAASNPSWTNTHADLMYALGEIERLRSIIKGKTFVTDVEPNSPNPFDGAAILGAPRERRISMRFETDEQYQAAIAFLDMADEPPIAHSKSQQKRFDAMRGVTEGPHCSTCECYDK